MRIINSLFIASALLFLAPNLALADERFEVKLSALWPGINNPRSESISSNNAEDHEFYIDGWVLHKWGRLNDFQSRLVTGDSNLEDIFNVGFRPSNYVQNASLTAGQQFEIYGKLSELNSFNPNNPIDITFNDLAVLQHFLGVRYSESNVKVRRNVHINANSYSEDGKTIFSAGFYNVYTNAANNKHILSVGVSVDYESGFARNEEREIDALIAEKLTLQKTINELSDIILEKEETIAKLRDQLGQIGTPPTDGGNTYKSPREVKQKIKALNAEIKNLKKILLGFKK